MRKINNKNINGNFFIENFDEREEKDRVKISLGIKNHDSSETYKNADIMKSAAEAVDYLKTTDYNFMKIHQYSLENDLNFARNL